MALTPYCGIYNCIGNLLGKFANLARLTVDKRSGTFFIVKRPVVIDGEGQRPAPTPTSNDP